jgi:hypothetical protein
MRAYLLSLSLLATVACSLSTSIEPWFQNWQGSRTKSENVLQVAFGDGRRLFANHFFLKADAYFHSGFYQSIFDANSNSNPPGTANGTQRDACEEGAGFLGAPKDWLDRFSRHFFPSRHSHLTEGSYAAGVYRTPGEQQPQGHVHGEHCNHDEEEGGAPGGAQEILPWLRLSAELDPERTQTYVLGSYWLRTKLGADREAEQFLREGLQANPGDCELLLELGRVYYEQRRDAVRARNVLELGLSNLRRRPAGTEEADRFLLAQYLNLLALLEREQNNPLRAIEYYTALKEISGHKDVIQEWIDLLRTNAPAASAVAPH